jgi:platelet-activating factor acetylhydrolase
LICVVLQAGSTHPSFSDVFLILPTNINKLTGLRAKPEAILSTCVETVMRFVEGNVDEVVAATPRAEQLRGRRSQNATLFYHEK